MTDLTPAAEQQIRERLPHAKESGVGFSWRSVELLLAALDPERARREECEWGLADIRRQMEQLRAEGNWPVAKVAAERDAERARNRDLEVVAEAAREWAKLEKSDDGATLRALRTALCRLDARKEPCPACGCPGEQYDGHVCEEFVRAALAVLEKPQ